MDARVTKVRGDVRGRLVNSRHRLVGGGRGPEGLAIVRGGVKRIGEVDDDGPRSAGAGGDGGGDDGEAGMSVPKGVPCGGEY